MANPRKQIILTEIQFWKQNKLLPEQYCDFLMTLYSEGNEVETEQNMAVKAKEKLRVNLLNSLLFLVAIVLIVLLFAMDQIVLYVLIVVGIVALLSVIGAIYYSKKYGLLAPILQIVAALLIFGVSVKVSITYFPDNLNILYSLLIANCLIWLGIGILRKLIYFIIAGSLGLIILLGYQFFI